MASRDIQPCELILRSVTLPENMYQAVGIKDFEKPIYRYLKVRSLENVLETIYSEFNSFSEVVPENFLKYVWFKLSMRKCSERFR